MKKDSVYKCPVCGLVLTVLNGCSCEQGVFCCGREMVLMPEQTADSAAEKHVPFPAADPQSGLLKVTVGEKRTHPMTEEHHIEWIEVRSGAMVYRKELCPGEEPCAVFPVKPEAGMVIREYCNVHGLWSYEIQ